MKKSFFSRILITYSVIICAMLLLFFSVFIILMQRDARQQRTQYLNDSFSSYVRSSENAFDSIFFISQNIKSMASMDLFAFSGGKTYYEKMTLLHQEMRDYASLVNSLVTTGGYGFFVHKLGDDTAVTHQKTQRLDALLEEMGLDPRVYRDAVKGLDNKRQMGSTYLLTDDHILYLAQKDYVDTRLVVTVYAKMDNLNLYPVDPEMQVGFVSDGTVTDLRTPRTAPIPNDGGWPGELSVLQSDGIQYFWTPSSYLGITYYYYLDSPSAAGEIAVTVLQVGLLLVLTCGIALALITAFSYRLYRPIDRLVNTLLSYEEANPSPTSQGELDYIAGQVVRIRHENQELVEKLETSGSALRAELVGSLLRGDYNEDQVYRELDAHGLSWLTESTVPVLFDSGPSWNNRITDDVAELLWQQMSDRFRCEKYLDYSGRLCILVQDSSDELRTSLNEIVTSVNAAFGLHLSIFIGPCNQGLERIRAGYIQVNRIVENRNRIGERTIYTYEEYRALPVKTAIYPIHNERLLIESAARGDGKETKRLLGYLFSEYVEPAFTNKESRDLILFALLNTYNRVLQQSGVEAEQVVPEGEVVFLELRQCPDANTLHRYVDGLFDRTLAAIRKSQRLSEQDMGEALSSYIADNLHKDISLLEIAENFNLSPNYMSALFKSTMGANFKDYLSEARFRRALEILEEEPGIRVGDLANRVGVANVNTFIRLFKKYSGTSPGQYVRRGGNGIDHT